MMLWNQFCITSTYTKLIDRILIRQSVQFTKTIIHHDLKKGWRKGITVLKEWFNCGFTNADKSFTTWLLTIDIQRNGSLNQRRILFHPGYQWLRNRGNALYNRFERNLLECHKLTSTFEENSKCMNTFVLERRRKCECEKGFQAIAWTCNHITLYRKATLWYKLHEIRKKITQYSLVIKNDERHTVSLFPSRNALKILSHTVRRGA